MGCLRGEGQVRQPHREEQGELPPACWGARWEGTRSRGARAEGDEWCASSSRGQESPPVCTVVFEGRSDVASWGSVPPGESRLRAAVPHVRELHNGP